MMQTDLFATQQEPLRALTPNECRQLLDGLAVRCVRNQSDEWWELCCEVAFELMTHRRFCPGSYLTTVARAVAKLRRVEIEPTTHNAWNSAIRVLFGEFAVIAGRVPAVTPQTHDRQVCQWQSAIYNPHARKPDWWAEATRMLPQ